MKEAVSNFAAIAVSIVVLGVLFLVPTGDMITESLVETSDSLILDVDKATAKDETGMGEGSQSYGHSYITYGEVPEQMSNEDYENLIEEAEKHLGKAYIFGASGPDNFDCSGYVSWVIKVAGIKDIERTTASGLTKHCVYVPEEQAKPGDLIFFSNTYKPGISHVAIYVGEVGGVDTMIHCGDPIQYESIETDYWQEHFYCFGRVSN